MKDIVMADSCKGEGWEDKVADSLKGDERLILLKKEGAMAMGGSIERVFDCMEVAQFTAMAALDAADIGEAVKLDDKEISSLRLL